MVVSLNATPSSNGRPFRFSRQFRLKSPLAIRRVMQDGGSSRCRFDGFRIICAAPVATAKTPSPRFAFVVSRDAGPAVVRNRIKRRLREAVRLQRDHWSSDARQIIFRINEGRVAVTPFDDLKLEVQRALDFAKPSVDVR